MFNAIETAAILRIAGALRAHPDTGLAPHAAELEGLALASAEAKAQILGRSTKAGPGRPGLPFAIALEPGWQRLVDGAAETAQIVNGELANAGRALTTAAAIQQAISRNGFWLTLLDTDNGTLTLTVRKGAAQGPTETSQ